MCLAALLASITRNSSSWAAGGAVSLHWTAPGDDGLVGQAALYDLRYSTAPITASNFGAAEHVLGLPPPRPPGNTETFSLAGLIAGQKYYFAIKTADEALNWSAISNISTGVAGTSTTATTSGALDFALSQARPDPARESVNWAVTLPRAALVQMEVYDVRGRRVRTLPQHVLAAGEHDARWDLHDDRGVRVPAGIYLLRAVLGHELLVRRVSVLR